MYYRNVEDKRTFWGLTLGILLLALGIGYAVLSSNLIINGSSKIKNSTWDIHFENISPKSGSVTIGTGDQGATINPVDDTEVTYVVTLDKPGDFYEFEVDAVNDGSVDGMVDTITSTYKIGDGEREPVVITDSSLPNYLSYSVTYSDGRPILQNHELKANTRETYKVRVEFKRDISNNQLPVDDRTIIFNFAVDYKQADSNAISVEHLGFNESTTWDELITGLRAGTITPNVGDTKTVDLGTFGTHTLRVANTTTPAECSTTGFSQTACGLVLEFADIITTHRMNPVDNGTIGTGNIGGWPASEMRTYVNGDIYNALPTALKNAIIDTTVVSGHGSTSGETNFTSTDKLYLLSPHEVWEDNDGDINSGIDYHDSAYNNTRQLDYYAGQNVTNSSYSGAIKQNNGSNSCWWLRSAHSHNTYRFSYVRNSGNHDPNIAPNTDGVSPAFRLR